MDQSGAIQASLSGRYASALFDLARESKAIEKVEASLTTLESAMAQSDDLRRLVASPLVGRGAASNAIKAVVTSLNLDSLTANFLGVLATNRRLGQAGKVIASFRALAANHRGEASATVTTAHPPAGRSCASTGPHSRRPTDTIEPLRGFHWLCRLRPHPFAASRSSRSERLRFGRSPESQYNVNVSEINC